MFSSQLRRARMQAGLSQRALANLLGISQQAYSKYESGASSPNPDLLARIASHLQISTDTLLGLENLSARKTSVPVLGKIPAGIPIEAIEEILDYEDLDPHLLHDGHEYFALRVTGNSMFPEYLNGDTIILRKQSHAETGDDAVIMVGADEATFKRIKHLQEGLLLMPVNTTDFDPAFYSNAQIEELPISILGVCVELRRKKK